VNAFSFGARLGVERSRSRVLAVLAVLGLVLVAFVSLLERAHDRGLAADRALSGVVFGLCIPLFCYASFEVAAARSDLATAISPFSRHGLARPALAQGLVASIAVQNALASVVFAVLAVLLTQSGHARFASELGAVIWIAALAGAAYTGLLALGSTFRRGRLWLLIGDWILGSGTGLLAVPWPRGHARNLLGFAPVLEVAQPTAAALLITIAIAGALAATRGLPR
jgi:hypothetical protein